MRSRQSCDRENKAKANIESQGIIYTKIGDEKKTLSPLADFTINFVDRQDLKILEE